MITQMEELVNVLRLKLSDYLMEQLEIKDPTKHFCCLHPDHDDKDPSMNMHRDGAFVKCHSCGRAGDIFTVASWLEEKPLAGPEFVQENIFYLADKFKIKHNIIRSDDARIAMKHAYLRAYKVVAELVQEKAEAEPTDGFQKEIRKRKWKRKESIELGLGCVNNFKEVMTALENNGFERDFIEMAGLMRPDIFNDDSLLFTIYDEHGRPIAFYSRDVRFEQKKAEWEQRRNALELSPGKPPAKYNSTANFTGIYEKPLFPYGLHDCKNFHKVIVVEGHGCKHSLRLHGMDNVIALGGLELSDVTLEKLRTLGVTNVVLLLDNDDKGNEKVRNIISKFYGKTSIEISVMDMGTVAPDVKDPDEFLRKYTVDAFKTIVEKHCIEWIVGKDLNGKSDPYTVLQDIVPLIALDRSPISRLKLVGHIADMTGIPRDVIIEEVNQKISASSNRKGEFALKILEEAKELLTVNPEAIDGAMGMINTKLSSLFNEEDAEEAFSGNEVLKHLHKLEERQESDDEEPIIKTGWHEFDESIPLSYNEVFGLVMGPPNTGKTALFDTMALQMLEKNDQSMVIIHTIDDSREVYLNRMIAALSKLKINWIKRPRFFLDPTRAKRRKEAIQKIADLIREDRLIIKDITHGASAEYHGRLIGHFREKYPERHIVSFCDNFHRLQYEAEDSAEGRHKFRAMSSLMKSYTTRYDCCLFCTVEMTKTDMYEKPTNASGIAEAAALQFDANLIIYLWNDQNCKRDDSILYFESKVPEFYPDQGYVMKTVKKPLIEALILKNKLGEFKGSCYFKFHPELALYEEMSRQEAESIIAAREADEEEESDDTHIQRKKNWRDRK